ncbi:MULTISPECIES: rhodanese-like domain-containing protein [Gulbenkiania]|uniref:Rhodanese-related sulfurtransferase n=2 Tax=Gulbenkiania TaxID=397456 RepID=A0A0K6GXB8_9NEIS|nr:MULTISPECIES: rhodanese-like domain-containing protein [Gulbenkiania]TCW33064.1 rhodanese-related sulfurtransferase [Gulbenkiania mobilis]CUA83138.1 Rhodanese-related sulfurtransferase [Gulbenkiania indica]
MIQEITPQALAQWLADPEREQPLLLDVREGWELEQACIEGVRHLPMNMVPLQLNTLPDDVPIVTICHHGVRSYHVALYLQQAGFDTLYSLQGGVEAWATQVDPCMRHY